ncbi:nuclease-related domain-containing protein [Leifsonia sp. AG29]|uniref:nuclease-related domain-containing protein n=1 Tax=Leifsonia sp. AG29 TaxID=2598860 RepID=UPI00131B0D9B|nr:nuclease-related domain-containing protein [Leifsonia sp. AG29]
MGDELRGAPQPSTRVDFAAINALSSRPAGYAVAQKCLEVQARAELAEPSLRTEKRVFLHGDAWPWYQGALGEIAVGDKLKHLGPEWFVRHSVPIGAGTKDVDHLVIGPGGVFAINTKHHADAKVWVGDRVLQVNGGNTSHIAAAVHDGADVAKRLAAKVGFPVPVHSVVAVLNARSIVDKRAHHDRKVAVIDAEHLVSWLNAQPMQLSTTKIDLIKLAAEEPETWHVDPHAAETLRVMQRFERLVARVGSPSAAAQRPTTGAAPSRKPPRAAATRSAKRKKAVGPDLVRLWAATVVTVVAVLVFRSMANQPCPTTTVCLLPPLYLTLKPLLMVAGMGMIGLAVAGSLLALVRRLFAHR